MRRSRRSRLQWGGGTLCAVGLLLASPAGVRLETAVGLGRESPASMTLLQPAGLCVDSSGDLYLAENDPPGLWRIERNRPGQPVRIGGGQNWPRLSAIAAGPDDHLYAADAEHHRVLEINGRELAIVAGTGDPGDDGDGGKATRARLGSPDGIAFDAKGNLYIADTMNSRIRRVTPEGSVEAVLPRVPRGKSLVPLAPRRVGADGEGNVYFLSNGCVTRIQAANGELRSLRCGFDARSDLAVGPAGDVWVADLEHRQVARISSTGKFTVIAGPRAGHWAWPRAVAAGPGGSGYVLDWRSVVEIDASNRVKFTVEENSRVLGDGGPAISAILFCPHGLARNADGNLYIADTGNHRIRKVAPSGEITTVAGTGVPGYSGDGGPASEAQFNAPEGLAIDSAGNLYVADTGNHRVRRISPDGRVSTISGTGRPGYSGDNGPGIRAALWYPRGLALDPQGDLYIADSWNNRVRVLTPKGLIHTIAGSGIRGYRGDGQPAASARLAGPSGIALDVDGDVFIADTGNHCIRRVRKTSGTISTFCGTGMAGFGGDGGLAARATLYAPSGVLADEAGNVFISDAFNHCLRVVSGRDRTIATLARRDRSAMGFRPSGLALDAQGNLFVADTAGSLVQKLHFRDVP
jgi:DNA-binding beta-propeller fold protein YncE